VCEFCGIMDIGEWQIIDHEINISSHLLHNKSPNLWVNWFM